eukprot:6195440-Amphidinium_carterae.2
MSEVDHHFRCIVNNRRLCARLQSVGLPLSPPNKANKERIFETGKRQEPIVNKREQSQTQDTKEKEVMESMHNNYPDN